MYVDYVGHKMELPCSAENIARSGGSLSGLVGNNSSHLFYLVSAGVADSLG